MKRRNGLTKQDTTAPKFPDLVRRDSTTDRPNATWVGDMTEIPTGIDGQGSTLHLVTVIDPYSNGLFVDGACVACGFGAATWLRPDAELACAAINDQNGRRDPR